MQLLKQKEWRQRRRRTVFPNTSLKALLSLLAHAEEEKNEVGECFSSLKKKIRMLSIRKGADWFCRSSRTRNSPKVMAESFSLASSSNESHLNYLKKRIKQSFLCRKIFSRTSIGVHTLSAYFDQLEEISLPQSTVWIEGFAFSFWRINSLKENIENTKHIKSFLLSDVS